MYPGMWAWVLQRVSALVLIVLFPIHVLNPYSAWLRITVLLLVIWHGMHGLKVILTDFGFPAQHQRKLLWTLTILGIVIFLVLAYARKMRWGFI
jgi:succinate dehydrogenase / fumarate reductase cytochrome b subunit